MKITEHIKAAKGKTLFSFEVVPPIKGKGIQELYKKIDPLMEFSPPFIDVTTSREEHVYLQKGDLLERKVTRMRPGTLGICAALSHKYQVDTVPHVLCGGFSKEETEYLLIDCQYLGIENVMILRGDSMKHQRYFQPKEGGHLHASDLILQVKDIEKGKYLNGITEDSNLEPFCIGVAGYPEKHIEAPSLSFDLQRLKEKVENGADYVVTQMFFNNQHYFNFVKLAREEGINVPIIPGIKPIAVKNHLQLLPQVFNIDLPHELVQSVEQCKNNKEVRMLGIEWCIHQSRELKKAGIPVLHYYSMGRSDNIKAIANAVF